jgi:hypothetical protein
MMNITNNEYNYLEKDKYQKIIITDLLYKPDSEFIKTNILGLNFIGINKSPNVYVVKTNNEINSEFLKFEYKGLSYILDNVFVHKKDDLIFLECKYWIEEIIES